MLFIAERGRPLFKVTTLMIGILKMGVEPKIFDREVSLQTWLEFKAEEWTPKTFLPLQIAQSNSKANIILAAKVRQSIVSKPTSTITKF